MFPFLAISSSSPPSEIVFFSSLKLHNTPYLLCSPSLFSVCIYPIPLYHIILKLFTSQEHKSLKRRGNIAYMAGFPTRLAECLVHSINSYSINVSNWMPEELSSLTKTRRSRTKSLDTKHMFFQLCRLLVLEIWIHSVELKKLFFTLSLTKYFPKQCINTWPCLSNRHKRK